jgi:hypothetical protein
MQPHDCDITVNINTAIIITTTTATTTNVDPYKARPPADAANTRGAADDLHTSCPSQPAARSNAGRLARPSVIAPCCQSCDLGLSHD